MLDDEETGLLF